MFTFCWSCCHNPSIVGLQCIKGRLFLLLGDKCWALRDLRGVIWQLTIGWHTREPTHTYNPTHTCTHLKHLSTKGSSLKRFNIRLFVYLLLLLTSSSALAYSYLFALLVVIVVFVILTFLGILYLLLLLFACTYCCMYLYVFVLALVVVVVVNFVVNTFKPLLQPQIFPPLFRVLTLSLANIMNLLVYVYCTALCVIVVGCPGFETYFAQFEHR